MTTKILVASLAFGAAIAFSPLAEAATKMKHEHMHAMHHHMHHRMAHANRGCHGEFMYHKAGKCMDARNKA
jgi:hypothetical protein